MSQHHYDWLTRGQFEIFFLIKTNYELWTKINFDLLITKKNINKEINQINNKLLKYNFMLHVIFNDNILNLCNWNSNLRLKIDAIEFV